MASELGRPLQSMEWARGIWEGEGATIDGATFLVLARV